MMPHLSYVSKERPCSALLNYWILLMPAPVGQEEEQVGGSQRDQSTWNIQLWIYTSFTAAVFRKHPKKSWSVCPRQWEHVWHTSWWEIVAGMFRWHHLFIFFYFLFFNMMLLPIWTLKRYFKITIMTTEGKIEGGRVSGWNCIKCSATAVFSLCCSKFTQLTWQSSAWQLSPLIEALVWTPGTWFEYL